MILNCCVGMPHSKIGAPLDSRPSECSFRSLYRGPYLGKLYSRCTQVGFNIISGQMCYPNLSFRFYSNESTADSRVRCTPDFLTIWQFAKCKARRIWFISMKEKINLVNGSREYIALVLRNWKKGNQEITLFHKVLMLLSKRKPSHKHTFMSTFKVRYITYDADRLVFEFGASCTLHPH